MVFGVRVTGVMGGIADNTLFSQLHYIIMGHADEARAEAEEVIKINPKFSLESYAKTLPFKNQAQLDRLVEALRKAGLK